MYRQEITSGATSGVAWPRLAPARPCERPRMPEEADRCLQSGRACEAARQMLAALGRRRLPLD